MFLSRCPIRLAFALAVTLIVALAAGAHASAGGRDGGVTTEPGTVITNSAEATYLDPEGIGFRTVSPTVTVTVRAVSGLVVTPDETEASAAVSPGERVTRLFRICNTGNTPDLYAITRGEVTAPATLQTLHFDADADGALTDADRIIQLGSTLSPRLARGECAGVLATFDTNASQPGSLINISITARSSVLGTVNGAVEDAGTIINTVGNGARLTSPDDPRLPPVKLVEGRASVTAAPGQLLNYTISFRNSGDVVARRLVLRDDIPAELDYVAGSLRLGEKVLTDAADADEGVYRDRFFEVAVAELKVGQIVRVSFQARVTTRVAPGRGVVNMAVVRAENAPSASSTAATAVVNPFGLVYEGHSGGANLIAGARVALLADVTTGTPLALGAAGSTPNDANTNPFLSDSQGRWSFVLSPEQQGAAGSPARYFLNVTAEGFRARMIEVTLTPDADGLFTLLIRALDGQPVARGGGFELSTEPVSVEDLAAFALNVPMFENSAVEIQKTADRPSAEVGEVVTYRVEVHNATNSPLADAIVTDTLPPSFHYAEGSARAEVPPTGPQPIEPEQQTGGTLVFRLGTLPAGARALVTYRVRIGANAREGEQVNTAVASGLLTLTNERASSAAARSPVRVRRGVFSMQQVIVGRVFEDANANGAFDDGERPLAGVRLYLNNGQSILTDSAGQYNFPTVGEGSHVLSLDPLTLPPGYAVSNARRRDQTSWTRLLRTPLGGGSMLRQNYALLPPTDEETGGRGTGDGGQGNAAQATSEVAAPPSQQDGAKKVALGLVPQSGRVSAASASTSQPVSPSPVSRPPSPVSSSREAGTYELVTEETIAPVAAGKVLVLSPAPDAVVAGAALELEARVANDWTVVVEVGGQRVPESKVGERRVDHKNKVTTFVFVGVGVNAGPNKVTVTAVGPDGAKGETVELTAYGRGPARRLEIISDKTELSAGGRDRTLVRVRALDQWGHPAADGAVALEVSGGRLLRVGPPAGLEKSADRKSVDKLPGSGGGTEGVARETSDADVVSTDAGQSSADVRQQLVTLTDGEGVAELVSDSAPGTIDVHATTGALEAESRIRVTPETRPTILVGLAEVSIGRAAPEISAHDSEESYRSRIAFFYRGSVFGKNLLTVAYDSQRPLNRTSGSDRLFQLDPLERAYPLFGDSSTRYEDAQSNSKLYARLDRGRSYLMFGDFETENRDAGLASYARKLTGVKLHVENSKGDFISVTGARPDTSFARDVFGGGALGFARLSHTDVLPGSEVVTIEVRDRRNPERIITREPLIRSVDYNLNAATGEIFFLRPVSAFDYALNLVQVVVAYEHRAEGMSSAVYTARAVKNFEELGLKVGLSLVEQKQSEFGSFLVAGIDAEKKLPDGGRLRAEWATSRGRVMFSGNLFSTAGGEAGDGNDGRHDGNALRVELEQPLPWRETKLRASFLRADQGFMNPFGATVTPGSQRAEISVDVKVRPTSVLHLGVMDERNKTENVDNRRLTGSVQWTETIGDRLRATVGYDFRRYDDEKGGGQPQIDSNLLTVGAEWQATDKLQLSVKREQNLTEADPTYPNQTTLAANYRWTPFTRLFFTQRLASAPITPIGDFSATGFAISGARRETAIGVETRLGRYANLTSRYQLENGVNGSDSFAVIGLQNRFGLTKELSLDLGYERGFHLAGEGQSFNNLHFGFGWQPAENFRSSARYELRDRGGFGHVLTLGAAGRIGDNITTLARFQMARANFQERESSATNAQAALAWRPLHTDRVGLLFSYTRRQLSQEGLDGAASTYDRADVLSSDAFYQLTKNVELYGRFALRFSDNGSAELVRVSSLAYLAQGRASYRLGRYFDLAAETRMLFAPSSATRRNSFGTELGYWVLPDLRLGGGYNWTRAVEPAGGASIGGRRGFYFTISSKLSNLFDLFGTARETPPQEEKGSGGAAQPENVDAPAPDEQP